MYVDTFSTDFTGLTVEQRDIHNDFKYLKFYQKPSCDIISHCRTFLIKRRTTEGLRLFVHAIDLSYRLLFLPWFLGGGVVGHVCIVYLLFIFYITLIVIYEHFAQYKNFQAHIIMFFS